MATGNAYAIATSVSIDPSGSATIFRVDYEAVVNDGVSRSNEIGGCFTYDTTQTVAANVAAFKTSVSLGAASFGFTVDVSNILVFLGVN